MARGSLLVAVGVTATLLGACQSSAPSADRAAEAASSPAPAPPNVTLADIFPAGPARDQVLNTCGSCHAVACVATGQKSADRWASIKASHRETVSGGDIDAMFAYLQQHFNDTTPEPQIPAELLQQGCTPF